MPEDVLQSYNSSFESYCIYWNVGIGVNYVLSMLCGTDSPCTSSKTMPSDLAVFTIVLLQSTQQNNYSILLQTSVWLLKELRRFYLNIMKNQRQLSGTMNSSVSNQNWREGNSLLRQKAELMAITKVNIYARPKECKIKGRNVFSKWRWMWDSLGCG